MTNRRRQRGMTLLEIMIVLAIIALVMGLLVGPKLWEHFVHSERRVARMEVDKLANEDYRMWQLSHTASPCPASLVELSGSKDIADPWGTDYKMYCGAGMPREAEPFGAASFGEDRREATADDIRSWE